MEPGQIRLGKMGVWYAADKLEAAQWAAWITTVVAWGSQAAIEARLQEHFDAGATQVCIQPVHPQGDVERAKAMLEALAPSHAS